MSICLQFRRMCRRCIWECLQTGFRQRRTRHGKTYEAIRAGNCRDGVTRVTEQEFARIVARQAKPEKAATMPAPTEQQEQEAVIQWAQANIERLPGIELLFHVPNENAHRKVRQGVAAGCRAGFPDLCLLVRARRLAWAGIELKTRRRATGRHPCRTCGWITCAMRRLFRGRVPRRCRGVHAIERYLEMNV
jgi:hypothetical protein